MLKIQVLGPGCANCERLEKLARQAVAGLGVEAEVEKVTDMRQIMARGVMATPGLAVNDKLVCTGRVPSASEVMTLIANVLAAEDAGREGTGHRAGGGRASIVAAAVSEQSGTESMSHPATRIKQAFPRWSSYSPALLLLLVIAAIAVWAALAGPSTEAEVPAVDLIRGAALLVVGLFAGFLGGIIGTGGCSVMLPAIHFWMDYPASMAVGTTLFAVIFTAASGGYGHLMRRNLDVRAVLWLGGGGILGVGLGSWLFTLLAGRSELLGLILGLVFVWPAGRMIWQGVLERGMPQRQGNTIPGPAWGKGVFGFAIGIVTGVAGLGGGYALVPGLIYLFGAPVYITMGTSLGTMIPLAVVGGGIKLAQGYVAVGAGLLLAIGTVLGAQVGAAAIKRFQPTTLKLIFGLYFLYVSIKFITAFAGISIW